MFCTPVFAVPAETMGLREVFDQTGPRGPPQLSTLSPYSLQVSLEIALFPYQALYQNSFRHLKGGIKALPESFGPWLSLAQNALHTKGAHSGQTCPEPFSFEGHDQESEETVHRMGESVCK